VLIKRYKDAYVNSNEQKENAPRWSTCAIFVGKEEKERKKVRGATAK